MHAGSRGRASASVVALRIALRATFAVLLLSAMPLLAVPLPGRSHIQRGYCRLMLRCLGVRITVSGGPIRNLQRRAGGQRACVVGGHLRDRRGHAGTFVASADLIDWPAWDCSRA